MAWGAVEDEGAVIGRAGCLVLGDGRADGIRRDELTGEEGKGEDYLQLLRCQTTLGVAMKPAYASAL